jgi:hypothetical protein
MDERFEAGRIASGGRGAAKCGREVKLGTKSVAAVLLMAAAGASAARLGEPARRAFDSYTATVEARLGSGRPVTDARLLGGGTVHVEAVHGGTWAVSGGLMHHWRAAALVPGATAAEMLALLRDYDHLERYYAPEVVSSRALRVEGDTATIAMRFRKQKVITVVLDAEFETRSGLTGAGRGFSVSRSTHIWEVDRPGSRQERREPEGDDDGFLWRLNSYWSFEETPGGLVVECQAVSLTRDVPAGLGWLVRPIIETLPRESLEFTLGATKKALGARGRGGD